MSFLYEDIKAIICVHEQKSKTYGKVFDNHVIWVSVAVYVDSFILFQYSSTGHVIRIYTTRRQYIPQSFEVAETLEQDGVQS